MDEMDEEVPAQPVRQTGEAGLRLTRVARGTLWSSLALGWAGIHYIISPVINTYYHFQTKSH